MRSKPRLDAHILNAALPVVAAAFARAGPSATIHECARDAAKFVRAAMAIRRTAPALHGSHVARAKMIAERYGAIVQTPLDPHGMSVGLVFSPHVHKSGFRSILFVC